MQGFDDYYPDVLLSEDKEHWCHLSDAQKIFSNTASFTIPTDIKQTPYSFDDVETPAEIVSRYGFYGTTDASYGRKDFSDTIEDMDGILPEDRLQLHACFKAMGNARQRKPTPMELRKRKEASAVQVRQYRKQFMEAKDAEIKS